MAITWEVTITPKCIAEHRVRVVAVRTDEVAAITHTITFPNIVIETAGQKVAVLDAIWNKYQGMVAVENVVTTVIGDMEVGAKANLEGREI